MKNILRCLTVGLFVCVSSEVSLAQSANPPVSQTTTIFLVRHAEKSSTGGRDPDLSEAGKARATQLAHVLKDAELNAVHSTRYKRTRSTAEPVATMISRQIESYSPTQLKSFADQLRQSRGRHLVVGHSNTTPALVKLLGGNSGSPINDQSEFDRLYVVTIAADQKTTTLLLRFGKPSNPTGE